MQNTKILYGIIGLLAGLLIAGGSCLLNHHRGMDDRHKMKDSMKGTMNSMMQNLSGKVGEEFDRAFIEEMTAHHLGAIDMANEALKNGKHTEIKNLANEIILAQTKEINEMKAWYKSWYGVDVSSDSMMLGH